MKRLIRICLVSAVFFLVLMSTAVASGDIIYVKVGGTGDGSSWASAYGDPHTETRYGWQRGHIIPALITDWVLATAASISV
jgi:hypothetical protein